MANILFLPLPETGHVNPTFKLARTLERRGHQVSYLSLPDLGDQISAQGLRFTPMFETAFPRGTLARYAQRRLTTLDLLLDLARLGMSRVFEEIAAALGAERPDLLLIDVVLRDLALVARQAGIRCALLSTAMEDARLPFFDPGQDPAAGLPILILCAQAFDFPGAPGAGDRLYIEPSVDLDREEPGEFPWDALDGSRPLIYCSLGSHCHDYPESERVFQAIVGAMAGRPEWQLVAAIGPYLKPPDVAPGARNVLVVRWAPQLALLKRAALMVTHGGLGTVKECISLGVPMIVFPVKLDQPANAARVVYHGLGVQGKIGEVSSGQIQLLMDRLQGDPSFKAKVGAMRRVFESSESDGIGCRIIERILAAPQAAF